MSGSEVSVFNKKIFLLATTSLALLCSSYQALAIVSMEDIHLGRPPEGFTGSFALDLALDRGNTNQSGMETGVKFQWTEGKDTDFILAKYAYEQTAGVTYKNNAFAHYRHIHQIDDQYAWEGLTQFSADKFANLSLRALAGGGVRITLGEVNDKRAIFLGLGAFYEHERINTNYPDEPDTENAVRASTYLVIKYQFNTSVSLVSATYYQPKIRDAADYRTMEDISVVSSLTEATSLKVGLTVAHDSEPPRGIKKTNSSLKVGIVINF